MFGFDVAAATASPAPLFVNAAVSALSRRCYFNVANAGSVTLPDGPPVKSSEVIYPTPLPTWRKRRGQLKTRSRTITEDLALLGGPQVYGLRRWNREWPSICIELAQDRRAWSAIVRDAVHALEAGQFRPG